MDLATFEQLLTPGGQAALQLAMTLEPRDETFLNAYEKVRKRTTPEVAKAAVETAILRAKAAKKFPLAAEMYFTREALEQASSWDVATYRAKRFRHFATVADFCSGIGGDSLALTQVVPNVVAVERDPLRARMTSLNAPRCHVRVADVLTETLPDVGAFFCDPSRRVEGKRVLSLDDYLPSPRAVLAKFDSDFPAAFKLAPGVPWEELESLPAEFEFISLNRELKECLAWFGPLRTTQRRATMLPSGDTFTAEEPSETPEVGEPLRYLFDPDPSITRAGLVTNLAESIGGRMIDSRVAFLTSDEDRQTPFALRYEVEATLPFHVRRVGEWLKSHQIGRVTIIKRGSDANADELLKQWKLKGGEHRVVVLTRMMGTAVAIIAR